MQSTRLQRADAAGPTTAVFAYGGRVFIQGAIAELKARLPGMMTLISLAISVAFVFSAVVTLGYVFFADLLGLVYVVNFVFSTIGQFFAPAESAMIPTIVPRQRLLAANSLALHGGDNFAVTGLVGDLTDDGAGTLNVTTADNIADNTIAKTPVGTGPYELVAAETVAGSQITYVARKNYWNKDLQKFAEEAAAFVGEGQ